MEDQTFSSSFEVEQVIDEKIINEQTHFLVKWVGYGHEENTWEPIRHMTHTPEKLKEWECYKRKQLSLLEKQNGFQNMDLSLNKGTSFGYKNKALKISEPSSNPFKTMTLHGKKAPNKRTSSKVLSSKKKAKQNKMLQKKKDLEIFEERIKKRPQIWEKYVKESDIQEANKKIRKAIDDAFRTSDRILKENEEALKRIEIEDQPAKQSNLQQISLIEEKQQNADETIVKPSENNYDIISGNIDENKQKQIVQIYGLSTSDDILCQASKQEESTCSNTRNIVAPALKKLQRIEETKKREDVSYPQQQKNIANINQQDLKNVPVPFQSLTKANTNVQIINQQIENQNESDNANENKNKNKCLDHQQKQTTIDEKNLQIFKEAKNEKEYQKSLNIRRPSFQKQKLAETSKANCTNNKIYENQKKKLKPSCPGSIDPNTIKVQTIKLNKQMIDKFKKMKKKQKVVQIKEQEHVQKKQLVSIKQEQPRPIQQSNPQCNSNKNNVSTTNISIIPNPNSAHTFKHNLSIIPEQLPDFQVSQILSRASISRNQDQQACSQSLQFDRLMNDECWNFQ